MLSQPARPKVAFSIAQDLKSSQGKAAKIFAKRRERAEKFTVDEQNVKSPPSRMSYPPNMMPPSSGMMGSAAASVEAPAAQFSPRPTKSPWQAAVDGDLAQAFEGVHGAAKDSATGQRTRLYSAPVQQQAQSPAGKATANVTASAPKPFLTAF